MIALVNGEPKQLTLLEILRHYIEHQEEVVSRRVHFELDRAQARAHILEGQTVAIDNIDEVIATIRANESVTDARRALEERFSLTEPQAQAIVDMTLGKLAGLERIKIEEELAQKEKLIKELSEILSDETKLKGIIKDEMLEIKRRFGDERRTEIVAAEDEIILEDLIERHTCVITVTHDGYIKRQPADSYAAQRRGGKGIIGMTTKDEDFVENVSVVQSHSYLMMFTSLGKVYVKKAYQIPEAGRTAKGTNIVNILELGEGEKLTAVISVEEFCEDAYLLMATRHGVVKRAKVTDFAYQRKGGKIAISLDPNDELAFVKRTSGEDEIILATRNGMAVRFNEKDARVMGRTARGVRGIRLEENDFVVGAAVVEEEKELVTITENGYGKLTPFTEYNTHSRGGKGVTCHAITEKQVGSPELPASERETT